MEWLEVTAPTIETARKIALDRLGIHEDDAEVVIVSEGKLGLFGRVKEEARIRVRVLPKAVRPKKRRGRGGRRSGSSGESGGSQTGNRRKKRRQGSAKTRKSPRSGGGKTREQNSTRRARGHRGSAARGTSTEGGGRAVVGGNVGSSRKTAGMNMTDKTSKHRSPQKSLLSLEEQADLAESFVSGVGEAMGMTLGFTRHDIKDDTLHIEGKGQ